VERKGDRFEVFKEHGLWHWRLIVAHSPSPVPVGKSGRGYSSKSAALDAIKSARMAAAAAPNEPIVISP
jgi:uncharacterized protein YegP (UPF0339 family)